MQRSTSWAMWFVAFLVAACGEDLVDPRPLGIDVSIADSVLFRGQERQLNAVVDFAFGPALVRPSDITWSSSDTTRAKVDQFGLVRAGDTGEVFMRGMIDAFVDSQLIRVVDNGSIRWRQTLVADVSAQAPAVDAGSAVYVVHRAGAGTGLLRRIELDGVRAWEVSTCPAGRVGPSVGVVVVVSGPGCTRAHDRDAGITSWTFSDGLGTAAAAQASLGRWVVPHVVTSPAPDSVALVLSRLSNTGAAIRRDTLFGAAAVADPVFTPIVTANDDAVMAWEAAPDRLVRIDPAGIRRIDRTLTSYPAGTSPAVGPNGMLLLGTPGALVALDSLGGLVWQAALTGAFVSSPVVDTVGNVYVQTVDGLLSYTSTGSQRWLADSLRAGGANGTPAPVVLDGGVILAICKGGEFVCWVDAASGALQTNVALGATVFATPGVAADGTVLIVLPNVGQSTMTGLPAVVALYSRNAVQPSGWPTQGRTMERTRREQ